MDANPHVALLRQMFDAAVASAQPANWLPSFLPPPPRGRLVVVGVGKAAAMAQVVEAHWPGEFSGVVVTRHGYGAPCRRIEVIEAAHPVPDHHSVQASRRVLAAVAGLAADDLVLCLISGGGSALLAAPSDGISLSDKQAVNTALFKSGATIAEMNCAGTCRR